jgi:SWI/SNF-related matrix-associated actin-dependent regulator of chromatin subfamily D
MRREIGGGFHSLIQIFGVKKLMFPQIPELLSRLLLPCDPIVLSHNVNIEKDYNVSNEAYDIEVLIDESLGEAYNKVVVGNPVTLKEISLLDEKIAAIVQSIHLSKLKHDFMLAFVKDPVGFINKWVASQTHDLEVAFF